MAFSESFMALIEQTWGGDRKAFETLYRILHKYLSTFIGDSDAASDLAQETLIHAWKQWPKLRDVSKVKSWLYTIATHLNACKE
jgi:DNA-directed RNA polymerase specialized sigma24 family protein